MKHERIQPAIGRRPRGRRAFWLKQLHQWHWISSAISLVCLLLFTATGITLNHAQSIEASPVTVERAAILPESLQKLIAPDDAGDRKAALPAQVADWLRSEHKVRAGGEAEWSADEVYLAQPRPGGDGWVSLSRLDGTVTIESTDRGWIAWLNDLHKGRNSGEVWKWFIDIFAAASFIFALTGLVLLYLHGRRRPSTWPLVGAGLVIPMILTIVFVHG